MTETSGKGQPLDQDVRLWLAELHGTHAPTIFRRLRAWARGTLGPADVEEIEAVFWAKLVERADEAREVARGGNIAAWLARVAKNVYHDHVRARCSDRLRIAGIDPSTLAAPEAEAESPTRLLVESLTPVLMMLKELRDLIPSDLVAPPRKKNGRPTADEELERAFATLSRSLELITRRLGLHDVA